jgi:P2 family phage contractile tail tube protein
MAKIEINRVTNANVYMDGASFLGRCEEITLPQVKHKTADHKALGMVGAAEFFAGIDKMEAKFKWNSFYEDVFTKAANPFRAVRLQARASLETHNAEGLAAERPVVVHLAGRFKEFPLGAFKQHDNVELETTMTVTYVKLVIDGKEKLEIDVMENIYKVDGTDILANYRRNIGA